MLELKGRPSAMERGKRARRPRPRRAAARAQDERATGERRLPSFDAARLGTLGLSRRELAVLELVGQGRTNEQIGETLGLSPLTVKKHLERMSTKLGASNRAALVAVAWQRSGAAADARSGTTKRRSDRKQTQG
jgi:DNA-binding CsgD family transcriptional regulator